LNFATPPQSAAFAPGNVLVGLAPTKNGNISVNGGNLAKVTPNGPGYQISATYPLGVTFSYMLIDGNGRLWGASSSGVIDEINVLDGTVMRQYVLGGTITGFAYDGTNIWAAASGSTATSALARIPAQ
jgi:hypothetical protein